MEIIQDVKKSKISSSKLLVLFLIGISSFFMVGSNDALLFNPFILSTVWVSYRLSPSYRNVYLIGLPLFSFFINLNYGLEILLVELFMGLVFLVNKLLKTNLIYQEFIPLVLTLLLLSIRYLSFNLLLPSIFNCLISISVSIMMAISLEKARFSFENPGEILKDVYKIVAFSIIYVLVMNIKVFNLILISGVTLLLIKYDKQEVVLGELLILFLYNYLFFNISIELLVIYLVSLTIASFSKKFSPIIFTLIVNVYYVVKYPLFYLDINFYFNIVLIIIYYYLFNLLQGKIDKFLFLDQMQVSKMEEKLSFNQKQFIIAEEYLTLLKKDPIEEDNIEMISLSNIERDLCYSCPEKEKCILKNNFSRYINHSFDKKDKIDLINQCLYPYKLIAKIDRAHKNYQYQISCKEEKKMNRELFNRQIDIILSSLKSESCNKVINKKKFDIEYEVITSSLDKENGDSYLVIEDRDRTIILLSDGMGHSKKAHQLSSYLIDLFVNSYKLTKSIKETLININLLLKMKSVNESFATLDVGEFDLNKGTLRLFKGGSFTSYLIRNKEITIFNRVFPPLGIIDKIDVFNEDITLMEGDYLIFLSDGFKDDCFLDLSQSLDYIDNLSIEGYISSLYSQLNSNNNHDDKTLLVVKVSLI